MFNLVISIDLAPFYYNNVSLYISFPFFNFLFNNKINCIIIHYKIISRKYRGKNKNKIKELY